MASAFVIQKGSTGKFHFNLRANNNEVVLTSESYEEKSSAKGGIESVRENSQDNQRFERKTAKDGSPFFVLTAKNGQVIGTSEMYSSTAAVETGIASVRANAPTAPIDDQTV
jgi:uncharacterized protein YegP (UPF0339 family)